MGHWNGYRARCEVAIGEDGVTLTQRSGVIVWAKFVHTERDSAGQLIYAMLDRKVHDDHVDYGDWGMGGCWATEMRRVSTGTDEETEQAAARSAIEDQIEACLLSELGPRAGMTASDSAALDSLIDTMADTIEARTYLARFWERPAEVERMRGQLFMDMDDSDLLAFDRLDALSHMVMVRTKPYTEGG